jgi:hypothetical protein
VWTASPPAGCREAGDGPAAGSCGDDGADAGRAVHGQRPVDRRQAAAQADQPDPFRSAPNLTRPIGLPSASPRRSRQSLAGRRPRDRAAHDARLRRAVRCAALPARSASPRPAMAPGPHSRRRESIPGCPSRAGCRAPTPRRQDHEWRRCGTGCERRATVRPSRLLGALHSSRRVMTADEQVIRPASRCRR